MKKLSALFFFLGLMISAQNNRAIYEYKYASDSTKIDSLKTEWMYLDISKTGSKYYSKSTFESDSIITESIKKQMASGMKSISISRQNNGGEINDEVEKTYPEYKTFLLSKIGNDFYKVTEDRKPVWKISTEKKKIGEFQTQKATTNFAGRNWIAWFTTDVPIQDGPYKFSGLPGLIVKISDSKGDYDFELVKSTKSSELKGRLIVLNYNKIENATETTPLKIDQAKQNLKNNPVGNLESLGVNVTEEQKNSFRNRLREQNNKRENRLELEF